MTASRRWVLFAVLVATALGALSYGIYYQKRKANSFGSEYLVGAIYDLTGSLSYMGETSIKGAQLAVDEINDAGGVKGKRLRLVIEDGRTNAGDTRAAFLNLIARYGVKVVVGFNSSGGAMATAPEAERAKVILFSSGAATPKLSEAGNYIFRNRLSGGVEAATLARVAYDVLGYRRAAILNIRNDYGEPLAAAFAAEFKARGGAITRTDTFVQDQTDFKAQLALLAADAPDFVYLASHAAEAGAILRQARERGLATKWLSSNAVEGPMLFELAKGGAEGLLLSVAEYDNKAPYATAFNAAYAKRYGKDADMFAAHAYDSINILARIIEERGPSAEDIRKGLNELREYPGVSGTTTFDQNGDVEKQVALKKVRNGQFVLVTPEELSRERGQ